MGGIANHAFYQAAGSVRGYKDRALLVQNYSAVTGACLLAAKRRFEEVEGFDEQNLPEAFNDVDFCLRLAERGYRSIWTPHALLYHHESYSREPHAANEERRLFFERQVQYMRQRWGDLLEHDPCYNPNLSLERADFQLAHPPRLARY